MMLRALAALLAAFGLAGCLTTQSEPFSLDGGDGHRRSAWRLFMPEL